MAPVDPHSFTDSDHPLTTHIALSLFFDINSSTIHGAAVFSLLCSYTGPISLDSRDLTIHQILDPFSIPPIPDLIKGSHLSISLSNHSSFLITFSTSPSSSALQWISPPQTLNKTHPFVYTQCQCIHARSIFPCQDTPVARVRYSALINIPRELTAVMSAKHVNRRRPIAGEENSTLISSIWSSEGRVVEEFVMDQPVPPYLFAFAVGKLDFRDVGPRTRVYTEAVDSVLDAAARKFGDTEEIIRQGERLFGEYPWERFDLLVMPPSFPYGGMENPMTVFLSPTVITADSGGAGVIAHELAHSWTGNLITNKSNEHFWLNEGFTTYAERRIIEAVHGEEKATLSAGIGWRGLNEEMERFKDNPEFTKLKTKQEGLDPDAVFTRVPYEKGYQFLWRIERQVS